MTDFSISATSESAMLAALTATGQASSGNFLFDGIVPGGGRYSLRVIGLLTLPISAPGQVPDVEESYADQNVGIEVPVESDTPLFWVRIAWNSDQAPPNWAAQGLTVYNEDTSEAVLPEADDIL